MQNIKRLAFRTIPVVLAVVMVVSMCLVVAPGPKTADAGEVYPELIAPGHTTSLNEGQFYIVTAKLRNDTDQTLEHLFARIYAKQAESPDVDSPPAVGNELCIDNVPVAPGTQDAGQDWDTDNDGWIENGSPSITPFLPPWWMNDRGLTSAGPDDGINAGTNWSDDEGSGDNAWPWIDTWDAAGGDLWMTIKGLVDGGGLVPDCPGVYDATTEYSSPFASFNHIRLVGDEPHVKQLDPLPVSLEQTVGWQIQCIGSGDVDIRVYFWEEGEEGDRNSNGVLYDPGLNCAGLTWAGNEELDRPCHGSLPDPADRDDWVNKNPLAGDGVQVNEDWIWFTESQLICQGAIEVPDIEIEFIPLEDCIPVGQQFELKAVVTNDTPCETGNCGNPGWARNVVARIDPGSLFPKIEAAFAGGTIAYVPDLAPGASATVTFNLACLEQGLQPDVQGIVTAQPDTCTPQGCYQCYSDTDQIDIWQCGKPELEVEIISPADFMWDPYMPLYQGAAIHTGGEFAITARVWNIGAERAENVWATLRDIPLDPKTEHPYFEVLDYDQKEILSTALTPQMYHDAGMQTWIPYAVESYLTTRDTYYSNYDLFGYQKYLGDIDMGAYKIVEWTLMPTDVWTESLQTCDEAKVTGFTVTAKRLAGYPQSSGVMIDDGPIESSIAAWISDWSTGLDPNDDICCNEAHCGNSFVSLQGTPMYQNGTRNPAITGWIKGGSQARIVIPEPMSFDYLDDIGVFVNSGTEATYGGPGGSLGDLEVGLGPTCCKDGMSVRSVHLPVIQINIETLTQGISGINPGINGDLDTSDTGIRIYYQPGTPGWRHWHSGADNWYDRWQTDADCSTWQYYGTGSEVRFWNGPNDGVRKYADLWDNPTGDDNWGNGDGWGWVVDWDGYDQRDCGVGCQLWGGNLQGFYHYSWDQIQAMFDRGTLPAIATVKSIEIRNNHSGTPIFVDDIRITDDFHGDIMKGDGPSEYTNDCGADDYLDCNCPGIIEATQVLIYPAADLEVDINDGDFAAGNVAAVDIGGTVEVSGVIKNRGAASAWDVNLEMAIEHQPGLYPSAAAGPDAYSKHFMSIPGGGSAAFSWTLNAYEPGAYRIDLMPSGMDECGWHVKQNADAGGQYLDPQPGGDEPPPYGNLLLVDDSSDYPIQWLRGDAVTAFVGVPMPDPSVAADITYPGNGDMFWKNTKFAVTAELTNDGVQDLTGVEATLMLNDIGGTESTIDGSAICAVGNLTAGSTDLATWAVNAGSITGDCILKVMVTSNEGAMDMDAVTVKIDPKVTLRLTSAPGGGIGNTADIAGEGDYMFDTGKVVAIKAVANPGMQFAGWVGDTAKVADVDDATTTVTMMGNYDIVAVFADSDCADLQELLNALSDYLDGQITVQELLEVLSRYLDCS